MQPFDFNLRHLRAVAAARRCGSVSAAAEAVNLSQPAVTQAIAKLEAATRWRLFERRPGGVEATEAGALLALRAEGVEAALAAGFRRVNRTGGEKQMTMTQLRALSALADSASYVGAAQTTSLSQPALHRAVRDLERMHRLSLVRRKGRGVALTEDGQRLVQAFRLALCEIEAALAELTALTGDGQSTVRIGAMPFARARLVPLAAARLHARFPATSIEVIEGTHATLIDRLRDGGVDFLIGALRDPDPGPDVVQELLFCSSLTVVAGSRHPLRREVSPTLDQLASYPWVIGREGTPMRQHWQAMFDRAGLPLPLAPVTCGSVQTIRSLLVESDFLTLLSPQQIRWELDNGALVTLGGPIAGTSRAIGLTTRRDWRPVPAQEVFMAVLREAAEELSLQEIQ